MRILAAVEGCKLDNNLGSRGKPIVFSGRLTEADVVEIQRFRDLLMVRRSIRWVVIGLASFLVALSLGAIVLRRDEGLETPSGLYIFAGSLLLGWAYLLFGLRLERSWQARRYYRRHADQYLETQVALSQDHVTVMNDDFRSEFRWRMVTLILDAPTGIMFCNAVPQPLFWLPVRLLGGGLREQVLTLAETNRVRVQRLA
jgi:hypothetical protein